MITFDSEKCFEDLLFDNKEILFEHFDLYHEAKIIRQVNLNPYGICDLLSIYIDKSINSITYLYIDLFELKNTQIKSDHLIQCARYKTFFDNLDLENTTIEFNCHLIGMKSFDNNSSDLVYLCQSIEWLSVYECILSPFEGIGFKKTQGWGISKNGEGHETKLDEKITILINEFKENKDSLDE